MTSIIVPARNEQVVVARGIQALARDAGADSVDFLRSLLLVFALGNVGRALRARSIARSIKRQWICWCIGVAILVHTVTFLGVAYYGQMIVMLYLELSLASCVHVVATLES